MSVWSILMRAVLAVGLILNGSGYAVASTHMQMDIPTLASTTSTSNGNSDLAAEPPCAEHHSGMESMSVEATAADTAADVTAVKSGRASADCCTSGACRCACVHQYQAAAPAVALPPAVIENVRSVTPLASGHESPVVLQLIRPPIG